VAGSGRSICGQREYWQFGKNFGSQSDNNAPLLPYPAGLMPFANFQFKLKMAQFVFLTFWQGHQNLKRFLALSVDLAAEGAAGACQTDQQSLIF
jgi:hypothetical protein